ncbi:MAG: hypothetical protein ABI353_15370 [Isosphaeraceae bacterium]
MTWRTRLAAALACALWAVSGSSAQAQYPAGFGSYGWGGWGGTVQGDVARGLGVFAMGAGVYNQRTAVANSINTDTVMRWNQYMHLSQMERNRRFWARQDRSVAATNQAREAIQDRLRNNPQQSDVFSGDALNVALDEINDPRVYAMALSAANIKIGGENVRQIPFQYAAAGITMSIHQLASGDFPAPLLTPEFAADRKAIKALDQEILQQIDDGKAPNPETVAKLLAVILAAEEKAAMIQPANGLAAKQASRFLMALHGLVVMLKTPEFDKYLAGVETRPETTLGELLRFMSAFNLRFSPATTPQQRQIYSSLYPKLVTLRDQVAPTLATAQATKVTGTEPGDFFSSMSLDDLSKPAPKP